MGKFLCLYNVKKDNLVFEKFEMLHLRTHPNFEEYHMLDDENHLFIFDISRFEKDIKKFIKGKYSKFSKKVKHNIINFFGEHGTIAEYIESYLYPSYYYEDYAEFLGVSEEMLKEVGELVDPPDLEKEDLKKDFVGIKLFK